MPYKITSSIPLTHISAVESSLASKSILLSFVMILKQRFASFAGMDAFKRVGLCTPRSIWTIEERGIVPSFEAIRGLGEGGVPVPGFEGEDEDCAVAIVVDDDVVVVACELVGLYQTRASPSAVSLRILMLLENGE